MARGCRTLQRVGVGLACALAGVLLITWGPATRAEPSIAGAATLSDLRHATVDASTESPLRDVLDVKYQAPGRVLTQTAAPPPAPPPGAAPDHATDQPAAQSLAQAQRKRAPPMPNVAKEAPHGRAEDVKREQQPGAKESVQADVSARNVAVTSSFNGTEIVIFGAVDGSQQPSAESGYYDVVIVVEGVPGRLVVRRKNSVAGLWLNTSAALFDLVPSYYAIASTRPVEEIVPEDYRALHGIGFRHLRFRPAFGQQYALSTEDLNEFREAIVRLKQKQGLYVRDNFGVAFIGRSLFRASIVLPANVTVGPFETRVMLFRDEKLLSQYSVRLNLEREGAERVLHGFALGYPTMYGILTVIIAVVAGLLASTVFRKLNG